MKIPYKYSVSILLGWLGFIGIFYSSRVEFNQVYVNFPWSIILPLMVTLVWGTRYGLISITFGLVAFYPFILGGYNGWASCVPTLTLYLWIIIHGYGAEQRKGRESNNHKLRHNLYFLQFIHSTLRLILYLSFFPLLIGLNPPFWNPAAYVDVDMSIILLFAVKGIIVETIFVALCDALLQMPWVQKIFRLRVTAAAKYNTPIMAGILGFGLVFTLIVSAVHTFIVDQKNPLEWLLFPNKKTELTLILASILFIILGGITVRFVQQMLETKNALLHRKKQLQSALYEIKELNAELEQRVARRTSALQAAVTELEGFASTVSHDLKSPLRAIESYAGILLEDYGNCLRKDGKNGDAETMVRDISHTSQEMIGLIDRLLEYATISNVTTENERRSATVKEAVDMRAMVTAVFEEYQAAFGYSSKYFSCRGDFPVLDTDRFLIKQVISNIVSNAVKFTSTREQPEIIFQAKKQNNMWKFTCSDNGVGFDMTFSDKLFHIFQRMHRLKEFPGHGIGLATIKKIVHSMGGSVTIQSAPEQGTELSFLLPDCLECPRDTSEAVSCLK